MQVLSKLYNALRSQSQALDDETELDLRCIYCTRKERLLNFNQLKPGDHICMDGQFFQFNIGDRKVAAYNHHAIVKSCELVSLGGYDGTMAIVSMIHFYSTISDLAIKIQQTSEVLHLANKEIYLVRYRNPTHPPETIIQRAERLVNENVKYSLISCNCENFCHWCCVGTDKSYQIENAKSVLRSILVGSFNIAGKVLKVICKLFVLSLDDLSNIVFGCCVVLPWVALAVTALLYLAYTIYKHHQLDQQTREGRLCSVCCLRQKQNLWLQFLAYCLTQIGGLALLSLLVAAAADKGLVIGALVVSGIVTLACITLVSKIRTMFCSPFNGRLVRVTNMKKIKKGDVISFDHWKISHDGIVCSVKIYAGTREKEGEINVIHYSLPSPFAQRTIVEEVVKIDLGRDLIYHHNYENYIVHSPEVVVQRARQRLGEKKFKIFSNRSCHFCHWAKVKHDTEDDTGGGFHNVWRFQFVREWDPYSSVSRFPFAGQTIYADQRRGKKHATRTLGKVWAKIRDDVKPAQIIEFKQRGSWSKGIITNVTNDSVDNAKISAQVVYVERDGKVCAKEFHFDLKTEDIWIHKFHPVFCHKQNEIIRRARARIGTTYRRPFYRVDVARPDVARDVVLKFGERRIADISEIKAGDIVRYTYWLLKHEAVVTAVHAEDAKDNSVGSLTIIHYALDDIFATRTVKQETMRVDLRLEDVYIKDYEDYVTYPPDVVVKRALSRLGEQRFALSNTSFDLVHWAKVIQVPAVISKTFATGSQENMEEDTEEFLFMPTSGSQSGEFQRLPVNSWSDLMPGTIVEYRYYKTWHQGIVSQVDEQNKTIKVIHYGADHLFAKRTIMENSLKVDLRYDIMFILRTDPRRCYKSSDVVRNARKRLGEQRWARGNRSTDFCKRCMLKAIDE